MGVGAHDLERQAGARDLHFRVYREVEGDAFAVVQHAEFALQGVLGTVEVRVDALD